MPAYHSSHNQKEGCQIIGGVALLPFEAQNSRGPAPRPGDEDKPDIIDETLKFFKANVFFQNFDVKGPADRLLIYLTLYTHQCILRISKATSQDGAKREMFQLAQENFTLPCDKGFSLSSFYTQVTSKSDSDQLRAYLKQCREELGSRLADRACVDGKPSKWWTCFAKRKFLGKALEGPGSR
eukprot:TRINITY_DN4244_c0_g1_i2.p1 TRINITY_DN4244_c0_g1~~TRINITY_DN4244_c0_g1_i2.p1  ORF type:complete len:182 (+),score=31.28 TRINITY_DN4244_c0_g1_i2:77-622(+)